MKEQKRIDASITKERLTKISNKFMAEFATNDINILLVFIINIQNDNERCTEITPYYLEQSLIYTQETNLETFQYLNETSNIYLFQVCHVR